MDGGLVEGIRHWLAWLWGGGTAQLLSSVRPPVIGANVSTPCCMFQTEAGQSRRTCAWSSGSTATPQEKNRPGAELSGRGVEVPLCCSWLGAAVASVGPLRVVPVVILAMRVDDELQSAPGAELQRCPPPGGRLVNGRPREKGRCACWAPVGHSSRARKG
ncbi:hypothetical protein GQ53DRAFT_36800 [Thozetella sp. PMI_491]|nr:hypothetical protein GQ53DRAFT_36800 [Thozetella sp. PMI_491]